ncbi:MAG: hypothetical protein GX647_14100 [Clostridiales bacterium]|jgi:hypothetical protein|nr:hypothetical protein [Clostridiales bacterium]
MDNLIFERVWQDGDLFEIEVTAQSEHVRARTKTYCTKEGISPLSEVLAAFPRSPNDSYLWENGDKGDAYPPYVSLRFYCKDRAGHIGVEVFMEIDDGGSLDRHHCCFELSAEAGMLNRFGRALRHVTEPVVGMRVELQLRD